MEITSVDEVQKYEHLGNNLIFASKYAGMAVDLVRTARHQMEQISMEIPDDASEKADSLLEQLEELEDALKDAGDEWIRTSVEIEDAIKAFERESKERRAC